MRYAALLITLLVLFGCAERDSEITTSKNSAVKVVTPVLSVNEVDTFPEVRQMLSRNCCACHDPGGKMYDKLPFDNPEIVRSNGPGILHRLDLAADRTLLEKWLSR
jgi:hypothetical protein